MKPAPLVVAIILWLVSSAAAAAPPTVLIGVDLTHAPDAAVDYDVSLTTEVAQGFATTSGVKLARVGDRETGARLSLCESPACMVRVTKEAGTTYGARVVVETTRSARSKKVADHRVSMTIITPGSPEQRWFERTQCDQCGIDEVSHLAYLLAVQMGERLTEYETQRTAAAAPTAAASAPAPSVPPAAEAPAAAPVVAAAAPAPADMAPAHSWFRRPWIPWVAAGGLVALGTGIYVGVGIGKESACAQASYDECGKHRDLRPQGLALGAAGAIALAAAGIAQFTLPTSTQDVALSIGPNGFAIRGAF